MMRIVTQHRTVLLGIAFILAASGGGCASKRFVHQEIRATADKLSARLDTHDDEIHSNTSQIAELITTNKQNSQEIDSVRDETRQAAGKALEANRVADQAQQAADKVSSKVVLLDERFTNRNRFTVLTEKTVFFKFNDSKLSGRQLVDLDEAARLLRENPDTVAVLEGRTDSTGDRDYNVALGQRRLESVAHYLVVDEEVPAYRIFKMSFGSDRPMADNGSRDGRSKNRCAVITILAPQTAAGGIASH